MPQLTVENNAIEKAVVHDFVAGVGFRHDGEGGFEDRRNGGTHANINRPRGIGMGRPSSFAVLIHSRMMISTFFNACE